MDDYRDENGVIRLLARNEPDSSAKMMRSGMTSFADQFEVLDRSKWVQVDRRDVLGKEFINDQGRVGGCAGASTTQAMMRDRALRGKPFEKLSWAMTYDLVNRGRDRGAVITDIIPKLQIVGTCTESIYPTAKFNTNFPPDVLATASRFRLGKALTLSTFDEMATAIQLGFIVPFPFCVGNGFENFDRNGICGFTPGPGNHAVHADSLILLPNGQWVLRLCNSWGVNWGPWKDGTCFIAEKHIESAGAADDAYCHMSETVDPQDSNAPPKVLSA